MVLDRIKHAYQFLELMWTSIPQFGRLNGHEKLINLANVGDRVIIIITSERT